MDRGISLGTSGKDQTTETTGKGAMMTIGRIFSAAAIVAVSLAGTASAQSESNQVAAETDWVVFEGADPKECWAVTAPKETVNTRDGSEVSVRRGDILLFVTYRPGQSIAGEVSFTGGYPFADGSSATLEVGGATFDLFTDGEYAWPATPADDQKIVTAIKRGADAVITARSARGTQTKDSFSLLGATAMIEEAEKRCGP